LQRQLSASEPVLDSQIVDFIRSSVKTVWSLELLLLMRRTRQHAWTYDQLIRELRSSRNIVTESISVLVQAGVLREEEEGFRYGPATAELDALVERLSGEYVERPTTIVNLIVEAQNSKLQDFANAFRIKKD
jgi:hypothetical protein